MDEEQDQDDKGFRYYITSHTTSQFRRVNCKHVYLHALVSVIVCVGEVSINTGNIQYATRNPTRRTMEERQEKILNEWMKDEGGMATGHITLTSLR